MSNNEFELPMKGQCQCGKVSYTITELPLTLYACHCTECQKQSSSGFGMSMPVPKTGFDVVGELKFWNRISDDGNNVKCAFCPACGVRIFHLPMRNEKIVNVKPGTLGNAKWIKPVDHLWVSSAQSGAYIPDETLVYSHQPESFEALFQAWQEQYDTEHACLQHDPE